MLTHDEKVWLIGANRIDVWFERLFPYRHLSTNRALPWLIVGLVFPTTLLLMAVLEFIAIPEPRNTSAFYAIVGVLSAIILVSFSVGFLSMRRDHPGNARLVEKLYDLRLLLPDEVRTNRRLLYRHRREIDACLVTCSNDDTVEMGISLDRRNKQLVRRASARSKAESLLAVMGLPMEQIRQHLDDQAADLQQRELRSIDRCLDAYSSQWMLDLVALLLRKDPDQIIVELHEARAYIQNHPNDFVAGR